MLPNSRQLPNFELFQSGESKSSKPYSPAIRRLNILVEAPVGKAEPHILQRLDEFTLACTDMPNDDDDAGASYLASLKQSNSSMLPGAAPTPMAAVAPAQEHRRSPRYKCKGRARVLENGSVATWATFADISVHGCYIETSAPSSVGTRLQMSLEANGFRISATGEVRVSYPGLGMGISFLKMADEDRERLRELLRSISRPSVIVGMGARPRPASNLQSDLASVTDASAALRAMVKFFEDRHMMGREEFFRILRTSQ